MKKNTLRKLVKAYNVFSLAYTGYAFIKARGTGKEDDRHLIGQAIDRIAGYSVSADEIITINETDIHVSYNPYMHLFTNSLGGIALVLKGTTEVYTDVRFRNMSKDTQIAILAHELGHYKMNHQPGFTYQFDRITAIFKNQVLQMELEADEYACRTVGPDAMISALRELNTIEGISHKEISLRIKHIMRNKKVLHKDFMKAQIYKEAADLFSDLSSVLF